MFSQWNDIVSEREELTLLQLNNRIKGVLKQGFPSYYWVRAETVDVRVNSSSGHCYLEFVEKDASGRQMLAKARGTIWARTFAQMKATFEQTTGQCFTSGIKVLVKVTVEFHELYGFSFTVHDIDPSYTIGDMARKRLEIISQLKKDGVFDMNRELDMPALPQRVAIITSPTAAGYEDFFNQVTHNKNGYIYYMTLFPAVMQGEMTVPSVIASLDRIAGFYEYFDVVVIIRGGGSTADLNSFDSYELAAHCAQFPLPIISGIGHERDDTVVDMVAHTRMKTPTAVAEFLINKMDMAADVLTQLQQEVVMLATDMLTQQKVFLQLLGTQFPQKVNNRIERNRTNLHGLTAKLPAVAMELLNRQSVSLDSICNRLANGSLSFLKEKERYLALTEQFVRMASPEYILKRGYSLTLSNGKIIKQASQLQFGEELVTRFYDGEAVSHISEVKLNKNNKTE